MTSRESDLSQVTCRLQGRNAVSEASGAARQFGSAQWLTEDELARLCIIVEEWVANLYDHGGLSETDEIELSLASEPAGIRVMIVDPGPPFDPREIPAKVERPERGGGAGIGIMRAWAQFVSYEAVAEGNRLELLLPLRWEG